ncbi:MAG: magnesium transporter [Bdellovibrionota bacterium]|nr:MAG: magnesium transporter [Bdellovibrionota bacterium]
MDQEEKPSAWETLEELVRSDKSEEAQDLLESLSPQQTTLAVSRMSEEGQAQLLSTLEPEVAADVMELLPESHAADILERLEPEAASQIVEELPEPDQTEILSNIDEHRVEAILAEMDPIDAESIRELREYGEDEVGRLMGTEFVAIYSTDTVAKVIDQFRSNHQLYSHFDVQYLYVLDSHNVLVGVVPLRTLLLSGHEQLVRDIMIKEPTRLRDDTTIDQADRAFEGNSLVALPIVGSLGEMLGVVLRSSVEEARSKRSDEDYLKAQGIIGGEELRQFPLFVRTHRRLSWLSLNIALSILSASVIAIFEDTLSSVIALAVFLPVISGIGGSAGYQAVAVSMRELALGLIEPREVLRVLRKEILVGFLNGLALGLLIALVALYWHGNPYLGMVVGVAMMVNNIIAVLVGGALPLVLRRIGKDPALASGPILTTITDMSGFFLALSLATLLLPLLK